MSYTFNIIHLTNVICLLPTCTCTYTHIHHLHTSFHVRYVNYFVYKKQSSLPVPGLRTCVPFLPLLGIPCDLTKSFHVSEPLSPVLESRGSTWEGTARFALLAAASWRCRAGRAGMCHSLQNNGSSDIPNAMAMWIFKTAGHLLEVLINRWLISLSFP